MVEVYLVAYFVPVKSVSMVEKIIEQCDPMDTVISVHSHYVLQNDYYNKGLHITISCKS